MSIVIRLMEENAEQRARDAATIARLRVKLQALEERADLIETKDTLLRHDYAEDHPRDESGRALGECRKCHQKEASLVAGGLCRICYGRAYRRGYRVR